MPDSDRSKNIINHPTTKPQTFINAQVIYFKNRRPGYYLVTTPIEDTGNGMITWLVTQGMSVLIEPATRFNSKTLAQVARNIYDTPRYYEQIRQTAERAKLTLTETDFRPATIETAQLLIVDGEPEMAAKVIKQLHESETAPDKKKLLEKALDEITSGSPEQADIYLYLAKDRKNVDRVLQPDRAA
jgi:hypothetical protein